MISMPNTQHQASVVGVAWLVELNFTAGVQRCTTAPVPITSGGYTWVAMPGAGVSAVTESADTSTDQIQLELPVVDTAMLAATLGNLEGYRGRRARLYLQLLDSAFQPVGAPVLRWAGYMEPVRVERQGATPDQPDATGKIVLPCSRAGMARARHRDGLRLTQAQQQRRFPADTGLAYVRSLIEQPQLWLSKRFQQQ